MMATRSSSRESPVGRVGLRARTLCQLAVGLAVLLGIGLLMSGGSDARAYQVGSLRSDAHSSVAGGDASSPLAAFAQPPSRVSSAGTAMASDLQTSASPSRTIGRQKAAVLLFNWRNDQRQPFTAEATRRTIFTAPDSVNAWYRDASLGKVSLSGNIRPDGDIFGWFTLPIDLSSSCDAGWWRDAANNAATAEGIDLRSYDHLIYLFPRAAACHWQGMATVRGRYVWINGDVRVGVIAHELGHNFGLLHASAYRCRDGHGHPVSISSNCQLIQYGDPFDVMGRASAGHEFSSVYRAELKWLPPAQVKEVDRSGTYSMVPEEQSSSRIAALRIPRDRDAHGRVLRYYYLEYRRPAAPFDSFSADDPVVNGISIRLSSGAATGPLRRSELIDTNPSTRTFDDAPLATGKTFVDTGKGISITTLSTGPNGASVRIRLQGRS